MREDGCGTRMRIRVPLAAPIFVVLLTGCGDSDKPDAFGNIEAREVVVAPETKQGAAI